MGYLAVMLEFIAHGFGWCVCEGGNPELCSGILVFLWKAFGACCMNFNVAKSKMKTWVSLTGGETSEMPSKAGLTGFNRTM